MGFLSPRRFGGSSGSLSLLKVNVETAHSEQHSYQRHGTEFWNRIATCRNVQQSIVIEVLYAHIVERIGLQGEHAGVGTVIHKLETVRRGQVEITCKVYGERSTEIRRAEDGKHIVLGSRSEPGDLYRQVAFTALRVVSIDRQVSW